MGVCTRRNFVVDKGETSSVHSRPGRSTPPEYRVVVAPHFYFLIGSQMSR